MLDVRAAMADDAPILLPEMRTVALGEVGDKATNVAQQFRHARGDLEAGYAEADVIVEREFTTAMVHQGYLEPQASTVQWRADDQIDIWTSTQGPFQIRDSVAAAPAGARFAGEGDTGGDRGRFRRQVHALHRPAGGSALAQKRQPTGEDRADTRRSVAGDRPHVGQLHQGEDGRQEGWPHHRG